MKRRTVLLSAAVGALCVLGAGALVSANGLRASAAAQRIKVDPPKTARQAVMIAIPGGAVQIGDDQAPQDERPQFTYASRPLLVDRTPVTVAQFRTFVAETGYVTDAERLGGQVLDNPLGAWRVEPTADWRHPRGAGKPAAVDSHPVTQVSWNDASAFCRAYGARLPTEFEWERAARLGQTPDGHVFKVGDPIEKNGLYRGNVWQGAFPIEDTGKDGFKSVTSPVGSFGAAPSGLTDLAGNVWEWTDSWYRPYADRNGKVSPRPDDQRVQRGGSFLCDPQMCQGFRVTARGHSTPDSALMHVGFRCVTDPGRKAPLAGQLAAAPDPISKTRTVEG